MYAQASDWVPLGSRYEQLFDDERVRKWVDYVARGPSVTAEVYFRRLGFDGVEVRRKVKIRGERRVHPQGQPADNRGSPPQTLRGFYDQSEVQHRPPDRLGGEA